MEEKPWAEIDDDWKRKEDRALAQRQGNAAAVREGKPVPYPNPFMALDTTKVARSASATDYQQSLIEFRKTCLPPETKRHII